VFQQRVATRPFKLAVRHRRVVMPGATPLLLALDTKQPTRPLTQPRQGVVPGRWWTTFVVPNTAAMTPCRRAVTSARAPVSACLSIARAAFQENGLKGVALEIVNPGTTPVLRTTGSPTGALVLLATMGSVRPATNTSTPIRCWRQNVTRFARRTQTFVRIPRTRHCAGTLRRHKVITIRSFGQRSPVIGITT